MSQVAVEPPEATLLRKLVLLLALTACALAPGFTPAVHAAAASRTCGEAPYSYAGIVGRQATRGIMATVELTADPQITHGHVAAWVGVGGIGLGPHGTDEWLQVGFATTESAATVLYYELALPRTQPVLVALAGAVSVGQGHRVGVAEIARRPGWWRVWLDGAPVTEPLYLEASHDRWAPVATSESWNGGLTSCNAFAYRFTNIRWSTSRQDTWMPPKKAYLIDSPGYSVRRGPAADLLVAGGPPRPPIDAARLLQTKPVDPDQILQTASAD